jgi:hypothetical protein
MATVSCARLQEHKAQDRCALCATRRAELDDLNLHVKPPLANDLASRFCGMESRRPGMPITHSDYVSPQPTREIRRSAQVIGMRLAVSAEPGDLRVRRYSWGWGLLALTAGDDCYPGVGSLVVCGRERIRDHLQISSRAAGRGAVAGAGGAC